MSSEQVKINDIETLKPKDKEPCKVNINNLMSKIREEQKRENKSNIIFFGIIGSVIFSAGIILSL